jgi:hypothetical protein
MKTWQLAALLVALALPASAAGKPVNRKDGIATIPSTHSVDQTVERLKGILQSKRITMKMPPTELLVFGTPKPERRSCSLL